MACTASPWPDTPKCKCVRRTRLLTDPMPRSSPGRTVAAAEQRIPEVRSCVQPAAPNSEVPAFRLAAVGTDTGQRTGSRYLTVLVRVFDSSDRHPALWW